MNGQARAGEGVGGRDEGGAGVEGFEGLLIVLMPPPGAGGGSEQSDRALPELKRGVVNGQARAGEGVGKGTKVAQVLKDLRVCLLY